MKAKKIYYIISVIKAVAFQMAFLSAAVYRIEIAALLPYQLILVGTSLEVGILLFEMPTGIVADLKSRKLSVIIGFIVMGIGFSFEATFPYFISIMVAQVIWGMGYTFISGALDAWLSDEVKDKNLEEILLTSSQLGRFGTILGIILAIAIGYSDVRISMYGAGFVFIILAIYLIIKMPEEHFTKSEHEGVKGFIRQLVDGLHVIRKTKVLKLMTLIVLVYGLYSEGIDRLYELHILETLDIDGLLNIPSIWVISAISLCIALGSIITLHITKKHLKDPIQSIRWIMGFTFLMILGILGFAGFNQSLLAVSSFLIFRITREGTDPLISAIQLRASASKYKATILSTFGQLDAIGQLISGPLMVIITGLFGVRITFVATAGILFLAIVFLNLLRQEFVLSE